MKVTVWREYNMTGWLVVPDLGYLLARSGGNWDTKNDGNHLLNKSYLVWL